MGERTFGKSLIQHLFPLPDGGALKLTVAEYLTPKQVGVYMAIEAVYWKEHGWM